MNKFIKNIISFSLRNKAFTFFWVGLLAFAGFISFKNMPIEAFPDVTNTQIIIVATPRAQNVCVCHKSSILTL